MVRSGGFGGVAYSTTAVVIVTAGRAGSTSVATTNVGVTISASPPHRFISDDGFGSRIRGRAGADINGLVMYLLIVPLLLVILYQIDRTAGATTGQIVVIGGLALAAPLFLWWAHKARREAEPLVRFLRKSLNARDDDR